MTNVLLIQSDQHRWDCVGATGHPLLQTPHLDRLAGDGASFTHAFTPSPTCTPARTSLMLGQWSFQHHVTTIPGTESPWGPRGDAVTFSRLLADQGWYLGYVGKWHVDDERSPTDAQFGFHDYVPEEDYARWRRESGIPPAPVAAPADVHGHPFSGRDAGRPLSRELLSIFTGGADPHIGPEQSRLAWGADRLISLLERRPRDRPFFLRWDPSEPHLPNVVPEPYASMYPPSSIDPWPSMADDLAGKPYIQAQQLRTWGVEDWDWSDWAPVVGRYLGEIALLDAQVGRVLAALEDAGVADDTLVVYTTDHGDMCGSHGMWDKHFVMYDDVVRVPLMLRWPGAIAPGTSFDGFVSHALDLAATFLSVAGIEQPAAFAGTSLLDQLAGPPASARQDMISAYHGGQFGLYSQRMLRDRRWKYVWNPTAEDELYDLQDDPAELRNLARDPAVGDELERLRHRLLEWLRDAGDPLAQWAGAVQLGEGRTQ